MHSRIFVYSKDNIADKSSVFTSSFNDHWFTNTIADYVVDSNLHEDIKWLKAIFSDLPIVVDDKNNFIIAHNDFQSKYFNSKYDSFTKLLSEIINTITLNKFSSKDINILNELW